MGRRGGGKQQPKPKVQYKVVQQSYEDKDYVDAPKPVLVPVSALKPKRTQPLLRFDDSDMPEDFTDKRNMLMTSDAAAGEDEDDKLFDDEVEEEFDEQFIKDMMFGDVPEEAPQKFEDDEVYPQHDAAARGALERQFDRAMRDFDVDCEMDEHDPRAHGQLEVEDYAPALEQFVAEHAGHSMLSSDLPMKHRGLLNQLKNMARGHRVFDSDSKGSFLVQLGDKTGRMLDGYQEDQRELRDITLEQVRAGLIEASSAGATVSTKHDADGKTEEHTLRVRGAERLDCMTVRTTASTCYNHPNLIVPAGVKKVKLTTAVARKVVSAELPKRRAAAEVEADVDADAKGAADEPPTATSARHAPGVITVASGRKAASDDDDDDMSEGGTELGPAIDDIDIDLSVRPKDETPEEKRARRKLVKMLQAERRQEKQAVKAAYAEVGVSRAKVAVKSKQDKAQMSLSVVQGTRRV